MDDRKDLYLSGALTINGQLHCKGDFEVKGNVSLKPGSNLIVDGKRTIHGSLREVK
jgi:cytoskeletal protein CcmA (bactofilin family)